MTSEHLPLLAITIPLAGIAGLFVGSFLNVVIYRAPLGLSVAAPRSFCPSCHRQLNWWENVPVVSWALLRGRCRTCHLPISIRYPLVELATAISFGLVTWAWRGNVVSAAYCALAATMISVGLIEYGGKRSPLSVAAIGTAIAQLIIIVGAGWQGHWQIVIGSLVGTMLAFLLFSLLRTQDPGCIDPRGQGRSAILIAGCWAGGLGTVPVAVGASTWIVTYLACMVGVWSFNHPRADRDAPSPSTKRFPYPLLSTPLVSAIVVAMVTSLITRG